MKYIVPIKEIHTQNVFIEAETEEEALEKVMDGQGDYEEDEHGKPITSFESTLPASEWGKPERAS